MQIKAVFSASMFVLAAAAFAGELDNGILRGATNKRAIDYAPGEEMTFTINLEQVQKLPEGKWFIRWTRSGDDGKQAGQTVPVELGKPLVVKTSIDKPGFVRVRAELVNEKLLSGSIDKDAILHKTVKGGATC